MRFLHLAIASLIVTSPLSGSVLAADSNEAGVLADEALMEAMALPAGYKRDVVLRVVSRNLRGFGQHEAGVRAARAMTDDGLSELPAAARPAHLRYVPLKEAVASSNPCDMGIWHDAGGGEATTPEAREAWAHKCVLKRDFHWIGLPKVEQIRTVAAALPPGETKAQVLSMLIRTYRDAETLQFVVTQVKQSSDRLPRSAREGLARMLKDPVVLYRLGHTSEALATARASRAFEPKAELIRLLIEAGDAATAAAVFEMLATSPSMYGDDCFQWFSPVGRLELSNLGSAGSPSAGLGAFLDRLPNSPLFRRVCAKGLDAELEIGYLLAAGRLDPAISRARRERRLPFLLVDALLQTAQVRLRNGNCSAAQALAIEAAAALPQFVPTDPINPNDANPTEMSDTMPGGNIGETSGNTRRRFQIIQMLAATGAAAQADALARKQQAGAMRAVALSAAAAGRAGMRFDEQAPMLSYIEANDL